MEPEALVDELSEAVTAGVLFTVLVVVSATLWLCYRQRQASSRTQSSAKDEAVFKVPQSPSPRTLRRTPIREVDVNGEDENPDEETDVNSVN